MCSKIGSEVILGHARLTLIRLPYAGSVFFFNCKKISVGQKIFWTNKISLSDSPNLAQANMVKI